MEEKLLLVALAELSDRDGSFITSMSELKDMMCASENTIDHLLGKLSIEQILIGVNKRTAAYRADGKIKGRLNFHTYLSQQEQNQNNTYNTNPTHQDVFNNAKRISNFNRSQISPLNNSTTGKTINVTQLSSNVVEEWAEVMMFRNGYAGQTNLWASFIDRLKENPNKQLYSFDEITSRLHSHLHSEKQYGQGRTTSQYKPVQQPFKRSSIEILEEKISNFNFKEDTEEGVDQ